MTGGSDRHEQAPPPTSLDARRVYFEQLTKVLLNRGLDGHRVGALVAELDHHLDVTGTDPVVELGPAGELAGALADATEAHRRKLLAGSLGFGTSLGLVVAIALALVSPEPGASDASIPVGLAIYTGVFAIAVIVIWGTGGSSLRGRRTFELPALKVSVPVVAVTALTYAFTSGLRWQLTTGTATALLVLASAVALTLGRWSVRRSRVEVPGRAVHLQSLEWGPFRRH